MQLFGRTIGTRRVRRATNSSAFHFLIASLVITLVFLHPPVIFQGDTDTARNYLNTIVSSLSTILALCISIILVAIQMTAGNYTHRVLDFFVRLPYNSSLFLVFMVTIMHSFFLMTKIRDPEREQLPRPLQPEMSADLILVVICFISLLIYMYAVVQLLKPERIIQLIVREYELAVEELRWKAALQSVEQMCDIVKRVACVNDSLTGTYGLSRMQEIARQLPMPDPDDANGGVLLVHQSLVSQWGEIIGVTVKERETGIIYVALDGLFKQGCLYIEKSAWVPAQEVVKTYRHVVFSHLLPEGQDFLAETVAKHLYQLAETAASMDKRGKEFAVRTFETIESCGENCFRIGNGYPSLFAGFLLSESVPVLLEQLAHTDLYERTVLAYFSLWKMFVRFAERKDVTTWANWWKELKWNSGEFDGFKEGSRIAFLLAKHQGRGDAAETLAHLLPDVSSPFTDGAQATCLAIWPTLFDGLPHPPL